MKLLFVHFHRDESSPAEHERIVTCAPESMVVDPFAYHRTLRNGSSEPPGCGLDRVRSDGRAVSKIGAQQKEFRVLPVLRPAKFVTAASLEIDSNSAKLTAIRSRPSR